MAIRFVSGCSLGSCDMKRWGCGGCMYMGDTELICDKCGCETDILYNFNDEQLCDECFLNHKDIVRKVVTDSTPENERCCEECGEWVDDDDTIYWDGYGWFCKKCLLDQYEMSDDDIGDYLERQDENPYDEYDPYDYLD